MREDPYVLFFRLNRLSPKVKILKKRQKSQKMLGYACSLTAWPGFFYRKMLNTHLCREDVANYQKAKNLNL